MYSIEPVKETFDILKENIADNGRNNVEPYLLAFSDEKGEHKMMISTNGWDAYNTLATPALSDSFKEISIETDTLDHFVNKNSLSGKIKMIKIDVEGWEVNVLKGGYQCLTSRIAPILMIEFTDKNLQNANEIRWNKKINKWEIV